MIAPPYPHRPPQALELGLVDRLGGLAEAVALAKQSAGLPEEEGAVRVKQVRCVAALSMC